MSPTYLDVHPMYGTIYKDGEFVQRGAVVGLTVDLSAVVVAPVSGWVRLRPAPSHVDAPHLMRVEIWQEPPWRA